MLSEKIRTLVGQWAKYDFTYNPYGPQIPYKYLYNKNLIRESKRHKGQCLADFKQDGYITEYVVNDKNHPAEGNDNPVIFSEIYHDLVDKNELCLSNYVYHIIKKLDGKNKSGKYNEDYYVHTIARGLRSIASFLREIDGRDIVEDFLMKLARFQKCKCVMLDTNVIDDTRDKTDILALFGGIKIRIWSYQVTEYGVNFTSGRIVDKKGNPKLSPDINDGLNLLLPFDMYSQKDVCHGWFFYSADVVRHTLINLLVNPVVIPYDIYYKDVAKDKYKVKTPVIFQVDK